MRTEIFNVVQLVIVLLQLNNACCRETSNKSACPHILTKDEWGGRKAIEIQYTIAPVEFIIIHHTVTPTCLNQAECSDLLKNMQNYHLEELGFPDIGYNFAIGGDGKVYEGAGWHKIGAHTKGYNSRSIGLGFIGTYTDTLPSQMQLTAAKNFIECAVELGELSEQYKLIGGRQVSGTQSPGLKLYREIQTWKNFATNV